MVMMDKKALHILQHALGLDEYGQGRQYRNHYVAGEGHHSWAELLALEAEGYMKRVKVNAALLGGDSEVCFSVTPKGIDAVALESPAPPVIKRSKKTYLGYLEYSECYDDFCHYLGFDKPTVEFKPRRYPLRGFDCRMKSSRGCGEWKPTAKEAKESYKLDMKNRRASGIKYNEEFDYV